ncbi:MAG: RNA ligase partner protein [Candidatus Bilamarchaeaceae archaeon]
MERFVLDTSLFVNPSCRKQFGKTPSAAIRGFVRKAGQKKRKAEFYMPPIVFSELENFGGRDTSRLFALVKKRAPNIYGIFIPAAILYSYTEDVRMRINKGLHLAEEYARDNTPDNAAKVSKLRERYRESMRKGLVDSKEDLEIILLAYELGARIVTADDGIIRLANQIGVEWIEADEFLDVLKAL